MSKAKWLFILQAIVVIYSLSSVFSKLASSYELFSFKFFVFYGCMFLMMMIYAIGWQQVIKYVPLITAYANKAISVVWGIIFGFVIFNEHISIKQIIGAAIVIVGIICYSKADGEKNGGN